MLEIFNKNKYVKLVLSVKNEVFDKHNKYVFTGGPVRTAILHPAQANDFNKKNLIKQAMIIQLCKEKQWDVDNFDWEDGNVCSFIFTEVPKGCAPITFRI